jgi:hypothetical protein
MKVDGKKVVEQNNIREILDKQKIDHYSSPLTEREIAYYLVKHLEKYSYQTLLEFEVNSKYFDIRKITNKPLSKVRIDVAAIKNNKITFIEVENGFWITHPVQYLPFAHRVILAYPAEYSAPTDNQQLAFAKKKGIGVIKISRQGSLLPVLFPKEQSISNKLVKSIITLFQKKFDNQK